MATIRRKKAEPFSILQRDPGPWPKLLINWMATLGIIVIFGLVMLFSASYTTGYLRFGDSLHFIRSQVLCLGLGVVAMALFSYIDYRFLRKLVWPGYLLCLALLVLVLFSTPLNGCRRWISFGGFTVQVSEIAKFEMILLTAHLAAKAPRLEKLDPGSNRRVPPNVWLYQRLVRELIVPLLPLLLVLALLVLEPHMSGIVLTTAIVGTILLLGGNGGIITWAGAATGIFLLETLLQHIDSIPYLQSRLDGWTQDLSQMTDQTLQSLYAIGSGGVTGLGLGNSIEKQLWLPESNNDFIFSVVCEELGFVGAVLVILLFVLFLVGLLYAWMRSVRMREAVIMKPGRKEFWKKQLLIPHILLVAVMIGMFRFTNFWDFIIYFVVTGGVVLFTNIVQFDGKVKRILAVTAVQAVEIIVISYVVSLPFTLQFDSMFKGVGIAQNHSMIHQLLILWGLPVVLTVLLIICIIWEKLRGGANRSLYRLMKAISVPDLFAIVMGLCAIGLIVIPELVYVRDIYENGNARANTMFKLTYQAYMLFGMTMGYGIFRMLVAARKKVFKVVSVIGLVLLCWTFGYFGNSVYAWFGKVWEPSEYKGLNATSFLSNDFTEDVAGIKWLKKNVKGSPVVLEANGDSYSGYERVSAMTGLPTVLGWYVHEWLWRDDTADLNEKSADIESIYTSLDEEYVKELLEEYDVSYIFVGSKEREKYGDALNEEVLNSLGEVVFQDEEYSTYILKVNK